MTRTTTETDAPRSERAVLQLAFLVSRRLQLASDGAARSYLVKQLIAQSENDVLNE